MINPLINMKIKINNVCQNSCTYCIFHSSNELLSLETIIKFFEDVKYRDFHFFFTLQIGETNEIRLVRPSRDAPRARYCLGAEATN